jgi:isoleucyl-tRNA synthetase
VALAVVVDAGLREEGLARELIHAVQLARKNAGLRIEDTIDLALELPDDLRELAERHAAVIRAETLASSFSYLGGDGRYKEQVRVEGREVCIALTPSGTIFTVGYG